MYSTVQSVVFSLLPPPSLKSEHWSQQSTFFFLSFFFFLLLCLYCQTFHIPNPVCIKQHPVGVGEKHQCTWSQETLGNISSLSSVMRDEETKVKTQGRKSIGFILVSKCCMALCFLEFVHIRKCDLYKFLLILSQWQWLIVFSSQNIRSPNKPEFSPFHATVPLIPGEDWYERKLKLRGNGLKNHTTTICDCINPTKFLYYCLLLR